MIGEMRVTQSATGQITIKADLSTSPTSEDAPQGRVQISAAINPEVRELLVSPVLSLYQVEDRLLLVDRIPWANGYDTVRVRDLTRNMVLLEVDVLVEDADSLGAGVFDRAVVSLSEGMRGGICQPSLLDCLNAAKEACEHGVATFSYTCNGETLEVTCSFSCREPVPE